MTTADALFAGLADALRRRVAERGQAEERLGDFVFRESPLAGPGSAAQPVSSGVDWRYFITRTLAAVGEPGTLDLLERLAAEGTTVDALTREASVGFAGRLATADRIGGLAAAGLAGRDLESGQVRLTPLGSAVLAFVLEWERGAAGAGAAGAGAADLRGSA